MNTLIIFIKSLLVNRIKIFELAKSDFKKRFVGSYFGIAWMFIQPIVTVLIYTLIFQVGFKSTPPVKDLPYVIWLIPGIVPWFYFQESLISETNCLGEYSYLVKKVVFPIEIIPVIKLVSAFFVHVCFLIILLGVFIIARVPFMLSFVQIIYYSFAMSVLSLGLGLIFSSLYPFMKDVSQLVGIALQFGMWLTPIMYDESIFVSRAPIVEKLLKVNPFYYIVCGYRDSLLYGNYFWERPLLTIYYWCFTIIIFYIGAKLFVRLKPNFSDVL